MTDNWAQTCAAVLTSATAGEADKAACRSMLDRQGHDVDWPGALAISIFFLCLAWGIPRALKIIGAP